MIVVQMKSDHKAKVHYMYVAEQKLSKLLPLSKEEVLLLFLTSITSNYFYMNQVVNWLQLAS